MAARSPDDRLRVGEADRDRCVDQLGTHFVAGRLEQWELEDRVGKALVARTRGELDELVRDCQRVTGPAPMTVLRRAGACVAALAVIVSLAGLTGAVASGENGEPATCVSTGLAAPDGVDCPVVSPQQARLIQDAEKAAAAADQVETLQSGPDGDDRLDSLAAAAEVASTRAREAATDAQLIVADAPGGKISRHRLDAVAKKARAAAADAARAAVAANALAHR